MLKTDKSWILEVALDMTVAILATILVSVTSLAHVLTAALLIALILFHPLA